MNTSSSAAVRRLLLLGGVILLVLAVAPVGLARWHSGTGTSAAPHEEPSSGQPLDQPVAVPPAAAAAPVQPPAAAAPQRERSVSLTPIGQIIPGSQGFHGDVWAHKGFAYLGTWGSSGLCPASGVKVIDISDPAQPVWTTTVAAYPRTSQEDMVVRTVSTAAFVGDLLAVGIQSCGSGSGAAAGMALFDVTDPHNPVELGFFETGARGVHELDLIQQGERVLALLAVPYSESSAGRQGDFRIVDVSNPRRPVQLSHWGTTANLGIGPSDGTGCQPRTYGHSARASADGQRAYLSYWDAGVIVLDISNPADPRLMGRLPNPADEEGETHSVAEAAGGRYLLIADEDSVFDTPHGLHLSVQTASGPLSVKGCDSTFSRRLESAGLIEAELVDGGSSCANTTANIDSRDRVVVVRADGCSLSDLATRLASQGALALIAGVLGGPVALGGGGQARIPVVIVSAEDGAALQRAVAGGGAPVTLPAERHWSGLRIWDVADPGSAREVGRFQTPNSIAFPAPSAGYYTIHNPEVAGDLAFLSWYTDGVRVVDISNPAAPREVASHVPTPGRNPQQGFFPNETMVWGIHLYEDLVLLSDVNSGLHVLRLSVTD